MTRQRIEQQGIERQEYSKETIKVEKSLYIPVAFSSSSRAILTSSLGGSRLTGVLGSNLPAMVDDVSLDVSWLNFDGLIR